MLLNKKNGLGNPINPLQNPNFQSQMPPWQPGGNNYFPQFGHRLQKFLPMMGGFPYQSQQPQQPMQPAQGYPFSGYPHQNNQGYGGQVPAQPAWEQPKKGGIKGFISNLMAKRKG